MMQSFVCELLSWKHVNTSLYVIVLTNIVFGCVFERDRESEMTEKEGNVSRDSSYHPSVSLSASTHPSFLAQSKH